MPLQNITDLDIPAAVARKTAIFVDLEQQHEVSGLLPYLWSWVQATLLLFLKTEATLVWARLPAGDGQALSPAGIRSGLSGAPSIA